MVLLLRPPQNGATLYQNGAVPGRSWNEHDQKSYLERNDPEQGTTDFEKKWERGKIFGTRSCPERGRSWARAQHRNGIFRVRTILCQNDFQTRIFRVIGRSTGDLPIIFRVESQES